MSSLMPAAPAYTDAEIAHFLSVARTAIDETPFAWLATVAADGGTNARAVRTTQGPPGSDAWTRRILVTRTSRKVAEIRAAPRVTLAYQHPSGDRYIALGGRADIIDDIAEMRTLWPAAYDAQFPPGFADANMIIIEVAIDRVEVHLRGLTVGPFGTGRTLLKREVGIWRFIPAW